MISTILTKIFPCLTIRGITKIRIEIKVFQINISRHKKFSLLEKKIKPLVHPLSYKTFIYKKNDKDRGIKCIELWNSTILKTSSSQLNWMARYTFLARDVRQWKRRRNRRGRRRRRRRRVRDRFGYRLNA